MAKKKQKDKYPYLHGCYVDEGFQRAYHRKYLGGHVQVHYYKGAMLLSVGDDTTCTCHPYARPVAAWLRGDDLDRVIKILQEAKRVWLKSYKRAERILAKPDLGD